MVKNSKIENKIIYLVVGIFIITNLIVSSFSLRLDLSKGGAYTLSESSKKIIHHLEDVVNIKFYASSDLPTKLIPLKTEVIDLLNEYQKESKGKVRIKILDPKKDQVAANDAKDAGVPEIQFSQLEKDKYAITSSFFGITLSYSTKKEIIPQVTQIEDLEYNLTSAIYRLTNKELIKVGIVGEKNAIDPQEEKIGNFKKDLSGQFNIDFLDIATSEAHPQPIAIDPLLRMIVVFDSNSSQYDLNEVKTLEHYLQNNGKMLFFVDGVWVSENLTASPANHGLFTLLDKYGITLGKNLILSASAELVNIGNGQLTFLAPYTFCLKSTSFNSKTS